MAGAERMLTQRELNRALLARQLLLQRASLALPRAVERIGGIQAQYAPSAYIALWSRLEGFERADLTRALERCSLVQATVLRGTIHIVSRRDFWPWRAAVRETDEAWVRRVFPELTVRERRRASRRLREALVDGARHRDDLVELVGKDAWNAADVDLVRVPPSGTWERGRADLFALAEDWIGPDDADPEEDRERLVRRYLSAFGPARQADIRSWSRLTPDAVARALEGIGPRHFGDEQGKELVDLPRAPLPDPRDAGTAALPADLGRDPPRPCPAHRGPAGGLPPADLQYEAAVLDAHVSARRRGRRSVAIRARADRARAVPKADSGRAAGARARDGAASRVPRVIRRRSRPRRRRTEPRPCPCRRSQATRRQASRTAPRR